MANTTSQLIVMLVKMVIRKLFKKVLIYWESLFLMGPKFLTSYLIFSPFFAFLS